ncbi:hypothetical protein OAK91_03645 [Planctomycetaceae bacterium]|nr:hypothetical protein [Planctomycetaceae bacterium]
MRVVIIMQSQPDLFEIVFASCSTGGFTSLLDRGKQNCDQNCDDRDDDQKLDERKSASVLLNHNETCNFLISDMTNVDIT